MVARIEISADRTGDLISRYRAGIGVKTLAADAGVSRRVVTRWLIEAGVPLRDRSAAMYARMAITPPDERARLAAAANEATRGRTATLRERSSRAVTVAPRETWVGLGEIETAVALAERGIDVRRQVPVGPYNLDLAVDHVAIEVHRKTIYPLRFPGVAERTQYLREQGWAVVYLWCARGARVPGLGCVSPVAVDRVLALLNSPRGSFHVVRCTGEDATRAA